MATIFKNAVFQNIIVYPCGLHRIVDTVESDYQFQHDVTSPVRKTLFSCPFGGHFVGPTH